MCPAAVHMRRLYNRLVQQGLADIAGKKRHAADGKRRRNICGKKERLALPKSPDLIKIK